jgi:hypothetical protein
MTSHPPTLEVLVHELSMQDDGDGITYLKIRALHTSKLVYEIGEITPTRSSIPLVTPDRFAAIGMRYQFMAYDPADSSRVSAVKEWTAKLRLFANVSRHSNDAYIELWTLPRACNALIRYTTNGSSPAGQGAATYENIFRAPDHCRVITAIAVSTTYLINSELVQIPIIGTPTR